MSWIETLRDESKVERHACLTPTWSETAWFADYVLPMGHASERHDLLTKSGDPRSAMDRIPATGT
jgi:anaerobic selenocysteine-containing dehydrogenase